MNVPHPTRGKVLTAFFAVYVLWGSTYLFIKYTVASIPPLGMAGARFLLAGIILFVYARVRGAQAPRPSHWRASALVGVLLMFSNAGVAWSETRIPSGVASLLVAMTPCWMVLFDWASSRERAPHPGVLAGLALGLSGVAILVGPGSLFGGARIDGLAATIVLCGTAAWAFGSLYARKAPRPASPQLLSGMQMICGGAALSTVALMTHQWDGFSFATLPPRAAWSFLWLLTFGSLVAFSAYMYLLTVSTPARVSTYAYVNPVVAVFLGWAFAGETLSTRTVVAAVVIVGAVVLIVTFGASPTSNRAHLHADEVPAGTTDSA